MELVHRNCPICEKSDASSHFLPSSFDPTLFTQASFSSRKVPEYMHLELQMCGRCSLLYSSPAFSQESLPELYKQAAFDHPVESQFAAKTYRQLFERSLPSALSTRRSSLRVLDIGAGDGTFLHELYVHGIEDVVGIEPSDAPLKLAADPVRSKIINRSFAKDLFEPASFDVVVCFQTIEHVPEPLVLCREVYRILRSGGLFLIVCHNRKALSAKLLGEKSPIFDIEHLQLFCPQSLSNLLCGAGFSSSSSRRIWNSYPAKYWLQLVPLPSSIKTAVGRLMSMSGFERVPIPLPAGNLLGFGIK